jgi:serine/threonine protein kinase
MSVYQYIITRPLALQHYFNVYHDVRRYCRGHRHTPQMDMFSLGVLLFVMLTGCKPIPSAICTKLSYDRMDTSEFPGVKMSQFRRLSGPAQDLTLALMSRRPAARPSAMAVLSHPWMMSHTDRWYSQGVDLRDLAVPREVIAEVVHRTPRVDELLARARAARPPPPLIARNSTSRSSNRLPATTTTMDATPTTQVPPSQISVPVSSGATASNPTSTAEKQLPGASTHPNFIRGSNGTDSAVLPPAAQSASPAERTLSGSRLPPVPKEYARQIQYSEDRAKTRVGKVFSRRSSVEVSGVYEEQRPCQENSGARHASSHASLRLPLKPRYIQQPHAGVLPSCLLHDIFDANA